MSTPDALPQIIQGGMGVAVSNWRLANAVSRAGQLGVVSGTGADTVLVRRLQDGDPGGHVRRAMARFPIPGVAEEMLRRYYKADGRAAGAPYALLPMYKQAVSAAKQRVTMLANFVEVSLAKEGHDGPVGINLLTKVQMPNMASLYGAMLAGVNVVIMGAGIPREIPGVLDAFAEHRPATLRFDVEGLGRDETELLSFDPRDHWATAPTEALERPRFLAVVSAASLAATLARKSNGRVDGFVVEGPTAGGHNAPPRGALQLTDRGEPVYGERDAVDLGKLRELSLPFWLAGGAGSPEGRRAAIADGANGIQVGTLFAFCDESGLASDVKRRVLDAVASGEASVRTDPRASPTGYPFKVVEIASELQQPERRRICDIGYLRTPARTAAGKLVYRCPAEPVDAYVAKGGKEEDTIGRKCLCNGLVASVGYAQLRAGNMEPPLITSGDDLLRLPRFTQGRTSYSAADVIDYLLT
jgi:NAD(P)H-dependent flavin oxidoreductase YrpB (nitropropane dioxygenase family)